MTSLVMIAISVIGLIGSFLWGSIAITRMKKKLAVAKIELEDVKDIKESKNEKDARVVRLRADPDLAERVRTRKKPPN